MVSKANDVASGLVEACALAWCELSALGARLQARRKPRSQYSVPGPRAQALRLTATLCECLRRPSLNGWVEAWGLVCCAQ